MTKQMQICVLPGDGIGPEVTAQAVRVLQTVCQRSSIALICKQALIGGAAIDVTGQPLPEQTIADCKSSDAVLLGAVGGSKWDTMPANLRPEAGLLGIRAALGLYANLRPARVFAPLRQLSPLRADLVEAGVDLLIVRELTGGIYFGEKGQTMRDGQPYSYDVMGYRKDEIERIAQVAFQAAQKRGGKVTSIDKANVLSVSKLWRSTLQEVAGRYPQVQLSHLYVDNAAMQLVRNPAQFDVIVTGNLFGDILSDEAATLSGSIGMLPSASLGEGTFGLYEPVHGSAPDIAGQNIANPLAAVLSVAMMLRYSFGLIEQAAAIEQAVEESLTVMRTPDLAQEGLSTVGTDALGDYLVERVSILLA